MKYAVISMQFLYNSTAYQWGLAFKCNYNKRGYKLYVVSIHGYENYYVVRNITKRDMTEKRFTMHKSLVPCTAVELWQQAEEIRGTRFKHVPATIDKSQINTKELIK